LPVEGTIDAPPVNIPDDSGVWFPYIDQT
jgi:hypothetical protein